MDNDKVIIDRARLEELEAENKRFRNSCEIVCFKIAYAMPPLFGSSCYTKITYEGKDERIAEFVKMANAKSEEAAEYRNERDKMYERIHAASFIKRLKYLFTKEL